jgi:hypothetical protein
MADDDDRSAAAAPSAEGRFAALPPRIPLEDTVEVIDASAAATDAEKDENREVAWRWGMGIAPGG